MCPSNVCNSSPDAVSQTLHVRSYEPVINLWENQRKRLKKIKESIVTVIPICWMRHKLTEEYELEELWINRNVDLLDERFFLVILENRSNSWRKSTKRKEKNVLLSINSLTLSILVDVINGSFLTISSTTLLMSVLKEEKRHSDHFWTLFVFLLRFQIK